MSACAALRTWLDAGAAFGPEYRGGLSNHLPMGVQALHALGADAAQIDAFATRYGARLEPASAPAPWTDGTTLDALLGQPNAWPACRTWFMQRLREVGRAALLAEALPVLMPGCGAAAFHGLIRTAHAVSSEHDGELVDALAYWACRHLPLDPRAPHAEARGDTVDVVALLAALHDALSGWQAHGDLIFTRMEQAAAHPAFAHVVHRLTIDADTLSRLAHAAAERYAQTLDFTVLHLVTSSRALRKLMPFIEAPQRHRALRHFWVAYAAGVGTTTGASRDEPLGDPLAWPEIVARACRSDDEHVIKLVHACRSEARAYGSDELWRRAAARALT